MSRPTPTRVCFVRKPLHGIGSVVNGHHFILRQWAHDIGGTAFVALASWADNPEIPEFAWPTAEVFADFWENQMCEGK